MPSNFFSGVDSSTFGVDPGNGGALNVAISQDYVFVTQTAAETRTIAAPTFANQQLRGYHSSAGDCAIIVADPFNAAGNTVITLLDIGDSFTLQAFRTSAATYVWRLVHNDGGTLS